MSPSSPCAASLTNSEMSTTPVSVNRWHRQWVLGSTDEHLQKKEKENEWENVVSSNGEDVDVNVILDRLFSLNLPEETP